MSKSLQEQITYLTRMVNYLYNNIGGNSVKAYKALISQVGTSNPTAIEVVNTLGIVTYTRNSTGVYLLNCSGAFPDPNKVFIEGFGSGPRIVTLFGDSWANMNRAKVIWVDVNTIAILMYDVNNAAREMSSSFDGEDYAAFPIHITVYP